MYYKIEDILYIRQKLRTSTISFEMNVRSKEKKNKLNLLSMLKIQFIVYSSHY